MDILDKISVITVELVNKFMSATGQVVTKADQIRLVNEEAQEMMTAGADLLLNPALSTAENYLKEVADFLYVRGGYALTVVNRAEDGAWEDAVSFEILERLNRAMKSLHIALEEFLDPGILMEAVIRVHESNLSKLDDDGNAIFGDNNKVLKGPNYEAPYLSDLAAVVLDEFLEFTKPLDEHRAA